MQKKQHPQKFPLAVRAVMIDLDGTLLDTSPDLTIAINLMLEALQRPPLAEALVRTFIGKGVEHLVRQALSHGENGCDEALQARALAIFMDCYARVNGHHAAPYPGVNEGLNAMQRAGFPLACVTNKITRYTLPLLAQVGLAHYFSLVVAGDTLPKKKPDPLPLLHACRHFGIAPGEMLMIGDSHHDAEAARAAGCPVFCVPYGYNEGGDVRELDVDAIVSTLFEASTLLLPLSVG